MFGSNVLEIKIEKNNLKNIYNKNYQILYNLYKKLNKYLFKAVSLQKLGLMQK